MNKSMSQERRRRTPQPRQGAKTTHSSRYGPGAGGWRTKSPGLPAVSQATHLGGTEPRPAGCAFHEWMRKHLQIAWIQNPHQLRCLFWVSLIAFGSTWCSVFHQISPSSAGVFIMCHFENKRDAAQSSSKTIKHFIIRDGEGTGLTYNTGSGDGRTMWY